MRSVSHPVGICPRPGLSNLDRNRDLRRGDVLLQPEFSQACTEAVREAAFLPGSWVRLTPRVRARELESPSAPARRSAGFGSCVNGGSWPWVVARLRGTRG